MPSGVSSKVRTQIRGIKDAKKSNKNSKAVKAVNKFRNGGFLRGRKKAQEPKHQPTYYERDNAIVDSYVKELNDANSKYGGTSRNNEMSKINKEYQKMRENLNTGFDLMRTPKLKPIGPKPVSSNRMNFGGKISRKFKCGGKMKKK